MQAQVSDPKDFNEFDPKECVTSWQFFLETGADEAEIREIFEFVADEEQLQVSKITNVIDDSDLIEQSALQDERADQTVEIDKSDPVGEQARLLPQEKRNIGRRAYDKNELAPGAYGRRAGEAESSIRVGVTKVDQLINQVGELVITQLMLAQTAAGLDPVLYENLHRSLHAAGT